MIPTYNSGYPPDGSTLGQTKSVVRNNLDGTFQTLGIDHVNNNGATSNGLSGKPAGYHNIIRSVPQSGNPSAIAGYGQLYSKSINDVTTDTALFWETGAGLIQQLTTNVTPSASSNGYSFLPGGIIMQWGIKNSPGTSGTVTFSAANIAFPNNLFNVQIAFQRTTSNNTQFAYIDSTQPFTKAQFNYIASSGIVNLYWFAIGN